MSRNTLALAAATLSVLTVLILGLLSLKGPRYQRLLQADARTVRAIANLAQQIQFGWSGSGKQIPADLTKFPAAITHNPNTNQPFFYQPKSNSGYDLCTTFETDTRSLSEQDPPDILAHSKGKYCFHLDASTPAPFVPFYN